MKETKIESGAENKSKTVDNFPVKDLLESERAQSTDGAPVHTNLQNAVRKKIDIAEIMVATATYEDSNIKYQPIQQLVTYPLKRKIYFETIAHLETELQMFDEEELCAFLAHTKTEMDKIDIGPINTDILTKTANKTNDVITRLKSNDTSLELQKYKETYDKIMGNFKNKNFTISEKFKQEHSISTEEDAIQLLAEMAISDMIYQKEQNAVINEQITPQITVIINNTINQKKEFPITRTDGKKTTTDIVQMKKLSVHSGNERQTFMLAGAPACGKGTILEKVLIKANGELGIDPSDIVKINTDSHRVLVSEGVDLGNDKKKHASLNNDESSFITSLAYEKMRGRIAKNSAPHLLIDGVVLSQSRMDLGLAFNGNLDITVVTLNVDESLNRAYSRGEKEGRFVHTDYLVKSHETVSKNVIDLINNEQLQNKPIKVTIYDNNGVAPNEEPHLVAEVNLKTKIAMVQDPARLMSFHDKMYGTSPTIKDQLTIVKSGKSADERVSNMFQKSGIQNNISDNNLNASGQNFELN